jgi:hypothetical protein
MKRRRDGVISVVAFFVFIAVSFIFVPLFHGQSFVYQTEICTVSFAFAVPGGSMPYP